MAKVLKAEAADAVQKKGEQKMETAAALPERSQGEEALGPDKT